jgi:hypothetical protein
VETLESRLTPASAPPTGQLWYSTNWSGYALNTAAGQVASVSAKWDVPAVTGSSTAYSSAWVGIDGFASSSVEQIGTASEVHLVRSGRTTKVQYVYYAWWEMYPANAMQPISMTVNAGDHIQASVTYVGNDPSTQYNNFTLTISDTSASNGKTQSFSITTDLNQVVQRSSAEWIQEAPSSLFGVLPLANFGSINFTSVQAQFTNVNTPTGNVTGSIWDLAPYAQTYSGASSPINAIDMTTGGRNRTVIAAVSALNSAGNFAVVFGGNTPPAPAASAIAMTGRNEPNRGGMEAAAALMRPAVITPSFSEGAASVSSDTLLSLGSPELITVGIMPKAETAPDVYTHARPVVTINGAAGVLNADGRSIGTSQINIYGNTARDLTIPHLPLASGTGTFGSTIMSRNGSEESTELHVVPGRDVFCRRLGWTDTPRDSESSVPTHARETLPDRIAASMAVMGMILYGQNIEEGTEEDPKHSWHRRHVDQCAL